MRLSAPGRNGGALPSSLMAVRLRSARSLYGALLIGAVALFTAGVPARMWLVVADSTDDVDRAKAGFLLAVTGLGAAFVATIAAARWSAGARRRLGLPVALASLAVGVIVFLVQQANPPSDLAGLIWFTFAAVCVGAGSSWLAEFAWVAKREPKPVSEQSGGQPEIDQADASQQAELAENAEATALPASTVASAAAVQVDEEPNQPATPE